MAPEYERRASPAWLGPLPLHYGWVVVIVGVLVTLSSLGIARFAFGMILPSMAVGLQLSYSQMGAISTGNFIAYLVGALASGWLTTRLGARATIVASQAVIVLSLGAVALSSGFWVAAVAFTVTGLGSGVGKRRHAGAGVALVPPQCPGAGGRHRRHRQRIRDHDERCLDSACQSPFRR